MAIKTLLDFWALIFAGVTAVATSILAYYVYKNRPGQYVIGK